MTWRPIALALTVLLPGLALGETAPQRPPPGHAVIVLVRGYRHATIIEGGQSYSVGQGDSCATATPSASFPHLPQNLWRETVIAGHRTVIGAASVFYSHPTRQNHWRSRQVGAPCMTAIRFTPEDGHTYRVTQHVSATRPVCSMEVIDEATGRPPPAFGPADRASQECVLYSDGPRA